MHTCPRPNCRLSYHRRCLKVYTGDSVARGTNLTRLQSSPKQDAVYDIRAHMRTPVFDQIPPDLLELACQPIIRGAGAGVGGGIAGNIESVTKARCMIYDILKPDSKGVSSLFRTWRSVLGITAAIPKVGCPLYECPKCGGPV